MKIGGIEVTWSFCFCSYPGYFFKGHHVLVSTCHSSFLLHVNTQLANHKYSHVASISYNQDHRGIMATITWTFLLMQG